ncbi:tRNA (N6-isopentenyl adenosine(37)-C2)-methylthiotransferase MiaB [Patescibacteria group bacterium]|nr:tRNA (N6-isopentenyl adenosine(37)-C2)-methylthiotransferase MiaB [Patescibacteria group bacterium]
MCKKNYKFHIITFGCQMNKNDSERMESILLNMGLELTDKPEEADVILLNSCSVRETAEARVFGYAKNLAELKKDKPHLIIGVTGCMPGRDKDGKMRKKMPNVDLYFPTEEMINLPKWLGELNPDLCAMDNLETDYLNLHPNYKSNFQAFVTIQTGCNHFCTYCVVPFARGTEGNRSLKSILEEVKNLDQRKYKEITLLGQIVNHYIAPHPSGGQTDSENFSKNNPYKKNDFAKLLWEINQFENIKRVHFTAPHLIYMDEEMIDALTLPNQVNYIHLPVQSGSNEMLRKMNRRHDRDFYIDVIKKIRDKKPDIAIGTDIIVGFCGETEQDFSDTVDLYKQCDFDISYHAQYSVRSGTVASKSFKDDVEKSEKKRRWHILQDLMEKITFEKNQKFIGQTISVLVDNFVKGRCLGNSKEMKLVSFSGDESLVGQIVNVKIDKADTWILWGGVV